MTPDANQSVNPHPVNPPRGMRDFLPGEKAKRETALGLIRRSYAAHGFDEIETPVLEDAARLHSGLGGDNEKLAFGILRRGLNADDVAAVAASGDLRALSDLGLRFDLTVPLARFYASHRSDLPAVFKAIQIAPVWRAERPQKGRYRQFMQCDIDVIGEAGPLAEIELITATAATLRALGLTGCSIRINDRRILRALTEYWEIEDAAYERALITIDKEDKIGVDKVVAELLELGLITTANADRAAASLRPLAADGWALTENPPAWLDTGAYAELTAIRNAVRAVEPELQLVFSPNLVRGMGYYTGTIFEIAHPSLGYSLGGGGRYDGMIGRFLGTDVPACGFSLGFERIIDLLRSDAPGRVDAALLVYDADVPTELLLALKSALLAGDRRVRLEPRARNMRAQLERAAGSGYRRFATVAADALTLDDLDFRDLGAGR